jgi:phosphatidate cytidylyltransferase
LSEGLWLIFFLVLVTWAGDTGAYYAGVSLGRRPLAPTLSPKKTVEGLIGGWLAALAAALVASNWFLPSFDPLDAVAASFLLTGAGLIGDLSESALKRSAGIKDSGGLLPGHGGVLDRIDSLLFSSPVFYYYVILSQGPPA